MSTVKEGFSKKPIIYSHFSSEAVPSTVTHLVSLAKTVNAYRSIISRKKNMLLANFIQPLSSGN